MYSSSTQLITTAPLTATHHGETPAVHHLPPQTSPCAAVSTAMAGSTACDQIALIVEAEEPMAPTDVQIQQLDQPQLRTQSC